MKTLPIALLLSASLVSFGVSANPTAPAVPARPASAATDKDLIDYLLRQDQLHTEEIARLKEEVARPKSRAELFANCMQAARSQTSAMGAEAIGGHCDRLLKDQ
jgi:hypothetical protein